MKVVVKSQKKLAKPSTFGTSNFTPPISLMKEEKAYAKGQYTTIKCKTNQADANSPTREIQIPYFKTGTPEELLDFWAKVKEVIMGQNMDPPAQFGLVRSLLKGDALTVWENRNFFHGEETEENFLQTYKDLSAHVFPKRAIQVQKCYLRRFIRKPHDMPFCRFAARVNELNEQLKMFPNGVLDDNGDAQGFADTQKLADEELLDILEFGLPHYWQKGLIELNIDLLQGTPQQGMRELAAYCERKELTESMDKASQARKKSDSKKEDFDSSDGKRSFKQEQRDFQKRKSSDQGEKYCPYHGRGNHDGNSCKRLLASAKKMRADAYHASYKTKREDTKLQKEELRAMVAEMIAKHDKQSKTKRKAKEDLRLEEAAAEEETAAPSVASVASDDVEMASFTLGHLEFSDVDAAPSSDDE